MWIYRTENNNWKYCDEAHVMPIKVDTQFLKFNLLNEKSIKARRDHVKIFIYRLVMQRRNLIFFIINFNKTKAQLVLLWSRTLISILDYSLVWNQYIDICQITNLRKRTYANFICPLAFTATVVSCTSNLFLKFS